MSPPASSPGARAQLARKPRSWPCRAQQTPTAVSLGRSLSNLSNAASPLGAALCFTRQAQGPSTSLRTGAAGARSPQAAKEENGGPLRERHRRPDRLQGLRLRRFCSSAPGRRPPEMRPAHCGSASSSQGARPQLALPSQPR